MIIFKANGRTLTLRSPELRNKTTVDTHTVIKRAMSGKYYSYKSDPATYVLHWDFNFIDREKVFEVVVFLKQTAGQLMTVETFDGEIWIGRIINKFEFTAVKVSDNAFSILFEGTKQ